MMPEQRNTKQLMGKASHFILWMLASDEPPPREEFEALRRVLTRLDRDEINTLVDGVREARLRALAQTVAELLYDDGRVPSDPRERCSIAKPGPVKAMARNLGRGFDLPFCQAVGELSKAEINDIIERLHVGMQ